MKEIPLVIKFGGQHQRSHEIRKHVAKKLYGNAAGRLNGYCDAKMSPAGIKIWINSRQSDREMVDTFFHEMTHVLLKIRFTRRPFRLTRRHEEQLCGWIGYLAKQQFADMMPKAFARRRS